MSTCPIPELVPGDVVYLPIARDGTSQGPITIEWVREERNGALCVGWHAGGEDHALCLPLDLAALGAQLVGPHHAAPRAGAPGDGCRSCRGRGPFGARVMSIRGGAALSRPVYRGSSSTRYQLRKLRGLPSPWVDATAARAHIQHLVAMGISVNAVALAAGLSHRTVGELASGDQPRAYRYTLTAVLAVDHRPHPAQTRVLSIGARRRVHALAAMGWSSHAVSAELGTSPQCLATLIHRPTMTYRRWAVIAEVYERLSAAVGPSRKALMCARNRCWPTPLAWEGIDIDDPRTRADVGSTAVGAMDPHAVDRALSGDHTVRLSTREKQECARQAREWGWSARLLADRLGISPVTADRALNRARVAA